MKKIIYILLLAGSVANSYANWPENAIKVDYSSKIINEINILPSANYSNAKLSNAVFHVGSIKQGSFEYSILSSTDFSKVKVGHTDFRNAIDISSIIVSTNTEFKGCNFTGLTFVGIKWKYLKLLGSTFDKALFKNVTLSNSDLACTSFIQASLSKADLSEANLSKANLSGADFTLANLLEADLSGANLFEANLFGANLFGANLSGANLSKANLSKADFTLANLTAVKFDNVKLAPMPIFIGTKFDKVNLTGVKFNVKADMRQASFKSSILDSTQFAFTDLRMADFTEATATKTPVVFTQVKLDSSRFTKASLPKAIFRSVTLTFADFSKADLSNANFSNSDLTNVFFDKDTKFDRASFQNAILKGSNIDKLPKIGGVFNKQVPYSNADFSGATWVDGTKCAPNSIGKCIPMSAQNKMFI